MEDSSKSRLSRRDFIKTSAVSLAAIGAGHSCGINRLRNPWNKCGKKLRQVNAGRGNYRDG
ncbi:MAG: twin-arginine translocation signal domain-containing protein [Planctomycetota bacterium]